MYIIMLYYIYIFLWFIYSQKISLEVGWYFLVWYVPSSNQCCVQEALDTDVEFNELIGKGPWQACNIQRQGKAVRKWRQND